MTLGWAPVRARTYLDTLITECPYAQWHVGDPGAAGTANVAANTGRTDITGKFAGATTAGATSTKLSNAQIVVASTAAEDYTHVSFWSAASGGTFGGSAAVTANPLQVGDNLVVPAGGVTLSCPNAA